LKVNKRINIGDLVKKTTQPGAGWVAIVVAQGNDQNQTILSNWVRVQYVLSSGYEWIQKSAIELISKHQ
jgi:MOSC domain-containing protein YiiM